MANLRAVRSPHRVGRCAGVGAIIGAILGGIVGLVVGLFAHPPTAAFAVYEVGIPGAITGVVIGVAAGLFARMFRRIAAQGSPGD